MFAPPKTKPAPTTSKKSPARPEWHSSGANASPTQEWNDWFRGHSEQSPIQSAFEKPPDTKNEAEKQIVSACDRGSVDDMFDPDAACAWHFVLPRAVDGSVERSWKKARWQDETAPEVTVDSAETTRGDLSPMKQLQFAQALKANRDAALAEDAKRRTRARPGAPPAGCMSLIIRKRIGTA